MPAQTVIQIRRDTAANWTTANPVLAAGEIGFDTTNNQIKIGNGTLTWTALDYASGGASVLISATAPADPEDGNVWYNSTEGTSYIYYDSFWVALSPAIVGPEGPEGPAGADGADGADGATGATGPSGVISVTAPITNSGTSTEAVLSLDTSNIAPINNPTFTGTVTGVPAEPDTDADAAKLVGYIGMPQDSQTTGIQGLTRSSAGKHIYSSETRTVILPANASRPLEIGATFVFISGAGATTTISIGGGDTLILAGDGGTGSRTLAPHGMATAVKVAATTWYISGNGLT